MKNDNKSNEPNLRMWIVKELTLKLSDYTPVKCKYNLTQLSRMHRKNRENRTHDESSLFKVLLHKG